MRRKNRNARVAVLALAVRNRDPRETQMAIELYTVAARPAVARGLAIPPQSSNSDTITLARNMLVVQSY